MKRIGEYTARGTIDGPTMARYGYPERVQLFDGKFDTAYKVEEFYIWGSDYNSDAAADCIGKLSLSSNSTIDLDEFFVAADNNEIAWATSEGAQGSANDAGLAHFIVDRENLVIEDLWVYARSVAQENVNYMIVMTKYDITEAHGAIVMSQNKSMDSGSSWSRTA